MRRHILVATDFSTPCKQMVRHIGALRSHGAEQITLTYVRREKHPPEDSEGHEKYYQSLLDDQADDLREQGWDVDVRQQLGRPGSAIVEIAEDVGAELIAVATRGHSAVEDVLLGSVATDVLERSPVPVLLYSDRAELPTDEDGQRLWNRIIHPTDFSEPADRALQSLPRLVEADPVPVRLAHIIDDRYFGPREGEQREKKIEERRRRLEDGGVDDIEVTIEYGHPKRGLVRLASDHPDALLVMGTHGHGWFEELVFGGVARSVARRGTNHMLFVPLS